MKKKQPKLKVEAVITELIIVVEQMTKSDTNINSVRDQIQTIITKKV